MRVLVADDDPVSRKLLSVALSKDGYNVELAADGQEALDKLQEPDGPQIAVLDWMMPRLDGVEVCRLVRRSNLEKYVYLVLLTARSNRLDLLEGMEAGADDYVVKPCDEQELKVRLRVGARIVDLQNQLLKRNQVIKDMVYALSHDLRTPLVALGQTMRLALANAYGELSEEYKRVLRNSLCSSEELLRLAETLLLLARYESELNNLVEEEVDLLRLSERCKDELEPLWRARSISVEVKVKSGTERTCARGNPQELRRLLINLIDNALKHTPEKGNVAVEIEDDKTGLRVSVVDTGYGVPSEVRAGLFKAFWRGQPTSPRSAGTGLGLYLCRCIVEAHSGTIHYSPNDAGGSTFSFYLPHHVAAKG